MYTIGLFSEKSPETNLTWLMWVALGFFALMVVVGWLVSRKEKARREEAHPKHEAHDESKVVQVKAEEDDLTSLEGIGPKVAEILKKAGITSFAGLAAANIKDLDRILDEAGLQMMDPSGWIDQAKLAAMADWDKLLKLQNELKGGRRRK